jgi:hypothetical protein
VSAAIEYQTSTGFDTEPGLGVMVNSTPARFDRLMPRRLSKLMNGEGPGLSLNMTMSLAAACVGGTLAGGDATLPAVLAVPLLLPPPQPANATMASANARRDATRALQRIKPDMDFTIWISDC